MTTSLIVHFCLLVIVACCAIVYLSDKLGRLRQWLAEHDERALLNRRRQAARDREMRKVEAAADRNAQMHAVFADVIHPTTPYCDYMDTPRDAMPRVRRHLSNCRCGDCLDANASPALKALWALDDLKHLKGRS